MGDLTQCVTGGTIAIVMTVQPAAVAPMRTPDLSQPIDELPNIGPKLAVLLQSVGILTRGELCELGSVEAALLLSKHRPSDAPCRSMLCALEGAIRSVRWHAISKPERDRLWRDFQARRNENAP